MKKLVLLFVFVVIGFFTLVGCQTGGNGQGGGDTHEHAYVDGKCECGATDPNYVEPSTKWKVSFYDGKELLEEKEYEYRESIEFPEAEEKEGQIFVGWFDADDVEFTLTLMPKKDLVLTAKYEAGYKYEFVDYDGTVISSGVVKPGEEITVPKDPERAKEGTTIYTFNGWTPAVTDTITEHTTFTATYTSQSVSTVTFDLDGGNWNYYSYDDVVKDLLKDYNKFSGKSYTTGSLPNGAWELINFHTFYFNGSNAAKWKWLLEYLGEVGSPANRSACKTLSKSTSVNSFTAANDNYKYSVSYELRAFIRGEKMTSNASFPTADYSQYDLQNGFWDYYLPTIESSMYKYVDSSKPKIQLPAKAYKQNYEFAGWYDNAEFSGSPITSYTVTEDVTIYAKFVPLDPVESIVISNEITEMEKFTAYTLQWQVNPTEVKNKQVKFKSSNTAVLSVTSNGVITALADGVATITITSVLTPSVVATLEIEVYSPNHFVIEYVGESYVKAGETTELSANYIYRDGSEAAITWESLTPSIATVNNGVVTGIQAGVATIRAIADGNAEQYQDFVVTVVENELSSVLQAVLNAHESNAFVKYNLGIGAGTPAYYTDVIGSVSKLLFEEFVVDNKYYATQQANSKNHGGLISSHEFVTVHYTGNMSKTADAAANASYFANETSTSIHYTTGNDGIYYILDEKYVGHHAGDGTSVKFEWNPTGVYYQESDPETPVWGINSDSKFTINGQVTSISVPTGSTPQTQKVTDPRWINDMGLSWKVVDGQYYMGTTWWCYSQISEGRICNKGGNNNSIGIESCVNQGSDLWYTWQKTARLVADIMIRNNLDITRVVGHHFYSAKDCPQPMLENDLEIWYEFIELVKAEYQMATEFADYELSFEVVGDTNSVDSTGRIKQSRYSEVITYKVTVTDKDGNTESITLATSINGTYTK
ncbi:MAG: N-acetylmuramoyl-L-alanine amidase [Bacilli bacterium]|nr:N-acetylmuramoyl-L-alanine amidase [Bacilli bacterium]